jgi:hypothetical protein
MVRRAQPKEDKVLSEKSSKAEILAAYDDLKEKAQTTGAELFAGTGAAKPSAPKPPSQRLRRRRGSRPKSALSSKNCC